MRSVTVVFFSVSEILLRPSMSADAHYPYMMKERYVPTFIHDHLNLLVE